MLARSECEGLIDRLEVQQLYCQYILMGSSAIDVDTLGPMAGSRTQVWRDDPHQRARLRELGSTPRARLTWLHARFLRADLSAVSEREWGDWKLLCDAYSRLGAGRWLPTSRRGERVTYVNRRSRSRLTLLSADDRDLLEKADNLTFAIHTTTATPKDRREMFKAQQTLRGLLEALVRGALHRVRLGRVEVFFPATRGGPAHEAAQIPRRYSGSLVAQMTLATLDYLKAVGLRRVRRCPYPDDESLGKPCGQLFLAVRRQRYCSPEHTRLAMYLRWRKRGSPRGTRPRIAAIRPASASAKSIPGRSG